MSCPSTGSSPRPRLQTMRLAACLAGWLAGLAGCSQGPLLEDSGPCTGRQSKGQQWPLWKCRQAQALSLPLLASRANKKTPGGFSQCCKCLLTLDRALVRHQRTCQVFSADLQWCSRDNTSSLQNQRMLHSFIPSWCDGPRLFDRAGPVQTL